MSLDAVRWAYESVKVKGAAKSVLAYLAFRFNEKNKAAWPGLNRIVIETGVSRLAVIRAIARLEELKLVTKLTREGPHGQNRYRLNFMKSRSIENDTSTQIAGVSDLKVEVSDPYLVEVSNP